MTHRTEGDLALEALFDRIGTYCILPSDAHVLAVALWVAHTHFVSQLNSTPRLSIQSPDKQSGKTRLLEVIRPTVRTPLNIVNMTPAVMFRAIAQWQPTFIIDEVDAFFPKNLRGADQAKEDIRGMINAGHRKGQTVMRVSQKDHDKIDQFPVFTPVIMAGIEGLPETIEDRSIILHMRRRRAEEEIAPYQDRDDAEGEELGRRLAHWASETTLPEADTVEIPLQDRPYDVWAPLFQVAAAAGGEWPRLLSASVDSVRKGGRIGNDDEKVILLRDIRTIAAKSADAGIHTSALVAKLLSMAESPWPYANFHKGINAYDVRNMLKTYGIQSRQVNIKGTNMRGYRWADFDDAVARYLNSDDEHDGGNQHKWSEMLTQAKALGLDTGQ